MRAYYATPEWRMRQREYTRQYRNRNKDTVYAANSEWRKAHPDWERAKNARRRAAGGYRPEFVGQRIAAQANSCFYCFGDLTEYHVDHFLPLNKGGTNNEDNLVIACPSCNCKKHSAMPSAFFARLEREGAALHNW
jgi:5-methylcytosine-specific restriction endonuclease McrA